MEIQGFGETVVYERMIIEVKSFWWRPSLDDWSKTGCDRLWHATGPLCWTFLPEYVTYLHYRVCVARLVACVLTVEAADITKGLKWLVVMGALIPRAFGTRTRPCFLHNIGLCWDRCVLVGKGHKEKLLSMSTLQSWGLRPLLCPDKWVNRVSNSSFQSIIFLRASAALRPSIIHPCVYWRFFQPPPGLDLEWYVPWLCRPKYKSALCPEGCSLKVSFNSLFNKFRDCLQCVFHLLLDFLIDRFLQCGSSRIVGVFWSISMFQMLPLNYFTITVASSRSLVLRITP